MSIDFSSNGKITHNVPFGSFFRKFQWIFVIFAGNDFAYLIFIREKWEFLDIKSIIRVISTRFKIFRGKNFHLSFSNKFFSFKRCLFSFPNAFWKRIRTADFSSSGKILIEYSFGSIFRKKREFFETFAGKDFCYGFLSRRNGNFLTQNRTIHVFKKTVCHSWAQ